jgi:hypothetical protein
VKEKLDDKLMKIEHDGKSELGEVLSFVSVEELTRILHHERCRGHFAPAKIQDFAIIVISNYWYRLYNWLQY